MTRRKQGQLGGQGYFVQCEITVGWECSLVIDTPMVGGPAQAACDKFEAGTPQKQRKVR